MRLVEAGRGDTVLNADRSGGSLHIVLVGRLALHRAPAPLPEPVDPKGRGGKGTPKKQAEGKAAQMIARAQKVRRELGEKVGHAIRFEDCAGPETAIE
eukprot:3221716-Pyramimonas_sp.AAC.2